MNPALGGWEEHWRVRNAVAAKRHKKRRWPWVLLGLLVFGVVFRLALNPIVEWQTRKSLENLEGYRIELEDVSIDVFKLQTVSHGVAVIKDGAGGNEEPVLYVEAMRGGIYWRKLLDFQLVIASELDGLKINLIAAKTKAEQQLEPETPNLAEVLEKMLPIKVDRVQVRNGEVTFTDKTSKAFPKLWLHDIELTVENLATRAAMAENAPTTAALSATFQQNGKLSLFLTADPLAQGLFFAGQAELTDFPLNELHGILKDKTGLVLTQGTLDVYAEIICKDGVLSGGIKPLIKNAEVEAAKPGLDNVLKEWLADIAIDLLSDRVKGRNAVSTVIPISGTVKSPQAQLLPTILGVYRNAFVLALTEGFAQVPPPVAKKPEGALEQAADALDPDEAAPKKQPPSKDKT